MQDSEDTARSRTEKKKIYLFTKRKLFNNKVHYKYMARKEKEQAKYRITRKAGRGGSR